MDVLARLCERATLWETQHGDGWVVLSSANPLLHRLVMGMFQEGRNALFRRE